MLSVHFDSAASLWSFDSAAKLTRKSRSYWAIENYRGGRRETSREAVERSQALLLVDGMVQFRSTFASLSVGFFGLSSTGLGGIFFGSCFPPRIAPCPLCWTWGLLDKDDVGVCFLSLVSDWRFVRDDFDCGFGVSPSSFGVVVVDCTPIPAFFCLFFFFFFFISSWLSTVHFAWQIQQGRSTHPWSQISYITKVMESRPPRLETK